MFETHWSVPHFRFSVRFGMRSLRSHSFSKCEWREILCYVSPDRLKNCRQIFYVIIVSPLNTSLPVVFFVTMSTRPDCRCVICRTSSVLAHGVATYCCQLFSNMCTPTCTILGPHEHSAIVAELERTTGAQIPSNAFLGIVRYVLSPDMYREYAWHIPFRRSVNATHVDYLYGFFHVCDQLLDIPMSVWIHFVWLLNRIPKHILCVHTLIPIVWTTLMVTSKLHDDFHFDNVAFMKVMNLCVHNDALSLSPKSCYENPYLQNKTLVPTTYVTLTELNILEELLLNALHFNLLSYHDRTDWPLFTCWCVECQPFHIIYSACTIFIQQNPVMVYRKRPNASWYCPIDNVPYLQEYKEFLEMFYLRLRQTYGLHCMETTKRPSGQHPMLPTILKRQKQTHSQTQDPVFFTNPVTELL